ncbi:matrix protein [Yerba mate chlorosis-associated virus]|uniref:Matrix protein n=1 Tax=Yerba mate chlorosis-associated virus TaxID=2487100 RepID=A0A3G3SEV7_9RHAB|nr:matrix protein [Yerba mate chlorosis-associated virus]AYR67255.1 matrix protein [Yerba mate chlorosis-associated virus]
MDLRYTAISWEITLIVTSKSSLTLQQLTRLILGKFLELIASADKSDQNLGRLGALYTWVLTNYFARFKSDNVNTVNLMIPGAPIHRYSTPKSMVIFHTGDLLLEDIPQEVKIETYAQDVTELLSWVSVTFSKAKFKTCSRELLEKWVTKDPSIPTSTLFDMPAYITKVTQELSNISPRKKKGGGLLTALKWKRNENKETSSSGSNYSDISDMENFFK